MKKINFLAIFIAVLCLFSAGCSTHNPDGKVVSEYDGKCSIYMTIDEYGLYHPQIVGWVTLKTIPDKVTLVCSNEKVELDIKAVNPSTNGLYVMNFKQEHIFDDLEKGDNPIHLLIQIGNKEFEIKNFDLFVCDDDYEECVSAVIVDLDTFETIQIYGMEKPWWWTPFY